jgi:hypothetical protein
VPHIFDEEEEEGAARNAKEEAEDPAKVEYYKSLLAPFVLR